MHRWLPPSWDGFSVQTDEGVQVCAYAFCLRISEGLATGQQTSTGCFWKPSIKNLLMFHSVASIVIGSHQ